MLQEIVDLREEGDVLYELLRGLDEETWRESTLFKDWTIHDVILHLHHSDSMALATARDKDTFTQMLTDLMTAMGEGVGLIELARRWIGEISGRELLERWRATFVEMCDCFAALDPKARLEWFGPDMGVRMFATARLMETWAHGQEIYDHLGFVRENTDRIKHVVVLGIKTFGWTFINRGLDVPAAQPFVQLESPSGERWEWGEPGEDEVIFGKAEEFAQVVTQVRHVEDTTLEVSGENASRWMLIAQCFAGPPVDPPAPHTRYRRAPSTP